VDSVDPPSEEDTRSRWLQDTLKDAEGHATPPEAPSGRVGLHRGSLAMWIS
jgi:hypothetical protein